jgi:DNA-binding transcriptional ArsR family regulator
VQSVLSVHVDAERLSRSRFALSRLAELTNGLEVLTHPGRAPFARRWIDRTRRRLDPSKIGVLYDLVGHDYSYVPDFIVPIPATYEPSLDDELSAIAATPPDAVRSQLRRAFRIGSPPDGDVEPTRIGPDGRAPLPAELARVLATGGGEVLAETVADQLRYCWQEALAESWPQMRRVLDDDVRQRAMRASREGFAAIVRDVDPRLGWDGTQLTLQNAHDVALNPEPGVVLTPSLFLPRPAVWVGGPGQVMVGYPARGRGQVWSEPTRVPGSIDVLGARRAALLGDLDVPRTTSELAARHLLSPATVSYHLGRMRAAGLVARRPDGHAVRYERTEHAIALLAAIAATPGGDRPPDSATGRSSEPANQRRPS